MKVTSFPPSLVVSLCLSSLAAAPIHAEEPPADSSTAAAVASQPWIGRTAPTIELESTKGEPVKLADLRGEKLVVVHFAASW